MAGRSSLSITTIIITGGDATITTIIIATITITITTTN